MPKSLTHMFLLVAVKHHDPFAYGIMSKDSAVRSRINSKSKNFKSDYSITTRISFHA